MENNKLQKGINEIKNIAMTDSEKTRIFESIIKIPEEKQTPKASPWVTFSFLAMIQNHKLVYYIVIPLVIILSSSGVVFASQNSLPDSILYPLKVKVVEPIIEGVLAFSPKDKANYEVDLATKRMVEAEKLARQGKLNDTNENKINNLLDKHTKALDQTLAVVNKIDAGEQSNKIISNFNFEMNTHAQKLDSIKNGASMNSQKNQNDQNNHNNDNVIKNSKKIERTNKMNTMEKAPVEVLPVDGTTTPEINTRTQPNILDLSNQENQISKKARMNADKINTLFKDKGGHGFNNKDK